jgi:hypothetical protein
MPRRYCVVCGADGPLGGDGRQYCPSCRRQRPPPAPCHGCGRVTADKARVRIGRGLEGLFCCSCVDLARDAAQQRNTANRRRWGRAVYLASRFAA